MCFTTTDTKKKKHTTDTTQYVLCVRCDFVLFFVVNFFRTIARKEKGNVLSQNIPSVIFPSGELDFNSYLGSASPGKTLPLMVRVIVPLVPLVALELTVTFLLNWPTRSVAYFTLITPFSPGP